MAERELWTAIEARRAGKRWEEELKAWLRQTHPTDTFRDPTREEDEELDIDLWWNGEPVSIKCQPKAVETGNLSLELERMDRGGKWHPSWFRFGKAKKYLFAFGRRAGVADKSALEAARFDRISQQNTPAVVERERNSSNPFVGAKNGLVSYSRLEAEGLLIYLTKALPFIVTD